jgi:hypothetical protein
MFSSRLFRRRSGAAPFEDQGRIIRGLFSRRALKAVRALASARSSGFHSGRR